MPEERPAAAVSAPIEAAVHPAQSEMPVPAAIIVEPAAAVREPVANEPMAIPVAAYAEAVAAATPVHSEPRHEPNGAPPAPVVDIEKALEQSGLVLVKTDPNKVNPMQPAAEPAVVPAAPRPRRAPPPDTGPLQIVETKK
jgi:hypothetical protein